MNSKRTVTKPSRRKGKLARMDAKTGSGARLLDREIGILAFNERVLAQAEDESVPLLERLRFLTIVSSNLDELFEIRVAEFKELLLAGRGDGPALRRSLAAIHERARRLVSRQYELLNRTILPQLATHGVVMHTRVNWTDAQRQWAERIFEAEIEPLLTPIALDPAHPFPRILNKSLNFVVELHGVDAFGRRSAEIRPDQTASHWTLGACPSGCDARVKAQVLLEEKDALGQVIRTQTDDLDRWDRLVAQRSHLLTPNDTVWSVRREFDARGALVKDDAPSLAGGDTGHRRLTYDALGRVLSEALMRPGEVTYATTSFTYNGLQLAVTDPLLHTTTRHLAAWGPVLRVTDAANGQVNYQYDAFDQLTQATDPAGNLVTRLTYNTRGMRTQLVDMDLGSWSFTPNALNTPLVNRSIVRTTRGRARNRPSGTVAAISRANHRKPSRTCMLARTNEKPAASTPVGMNCGRKVM